MPPLRKDDNVIPPASELSTLVSNLRHPRKRTVSVGPQSEADARELIANRERQRRNSRSGSQGERRKHARQARREVSSPGSSPVHGTLAEDIAVTSPPDSAGSSYLEAGSASNARSRPLLQVDAVNPALLTPPASDGGASSDSGREDERKDREMFSALEKPRIRYDVEVITKLVVYAGIGWWAVEGNPLLFQAIGIT